MGSKQTGIAVVNGFPMDAAWTGSGTFFTESGTFEADVKVDEVRDEDNELRTLIHSGEVYDGTLMFTPRAPANSNTYAGAIGSLPPPAKGSLVTLIAKAGSNWAGASHPMLTAAVATNDWVYVGGWKIAHKKDGITTYEMKIKRNPLFNIGAAVT